MAHVLSLSPAVLSLSPAVRTVTRTGPLGRRDVRPIAYYLAAKIDGRDLAGLVPHADGLVTPLQGWWVEQTSPVIDEWLGRTGGLRLPDGFAPIRHLREGRVPLLVGPWDDDPSSGWLTCRIEVARAGVAWRDLRWESGPAGGSFPVTGAPAGWVFDRGRYVATLEAARTAVTLLPRVDPDAPDHPAPVPGVPGWARPAWAGWQRLRHGSV